MPRDGALAGLLSSRFVKDLIVELDIKVMLCWVWEKMDLHEGKRGSLFLAAAFFSGQVQAPFDAVDAARV
jgi:hypothetical protein